MRFAEFSEIWAVLDRYCPSIDWLQTNVIAIGNSLYPRQSNKIHSTEKINRDPFSNSQKTTKVFNLTERLWLEEKSQIPTFILKTLKWLITKLKTIKWLNNLLKWNNLNKSIGGLLSPQEQLQLVKLWKGSAFLHFLIN